MKYTEQDLLKMELGVPKNLFIVRQYRYWKTNVTNSAQWDDTLHIDNVDIFKMTDITIHDKFTVIAFDKELEAINYIEAKIEKRIRYDIEKLKVLNNRSRELALGDNNE